MKIGVSIFCGCFLSLVFFSPAAAQDKYPSKPINFIFVYPPGGGSDLCTKLLFETMKKDLGVPIIPKYVTGAAGSVGAYELSKAAPNGYTVGMTTLVAMALVPHTTGVKFNPLEDFDFIGTFMQFITGYVVKADSPYKNLKDLIEAARKNPNQIRFGNTTPGGFQGLTPAYLEKVEKIRFKNLPCPGGHGEASAALLGGHVDFKPGNPAQLKPYIKSGHTRMIVSGSYMRHSDPSVPTLRELGYDFDQVSWNALGAPKGLPVHVKKRLEESLAKAVQDPEFVKAMTNLDTPIDYHPGDEYKKMVVKYHEIWGNLLKDGYRF